METKIRAVQSRWYNTCITERKRHLCVCGWVPMVCKIVCLFHNIGQCYLWPRSKSTKCAKHFHFGKGNSLIISTQISVFLILWRDESGFFTFNRSATWLKCKTYTNGFCFAFVVWHPFEINANIEEISYGNMKSSFNYGSEQHWMGRTHCILCLIWNPPFQVYTQCNKCEPWKNVLFSCVSVWLTWFVLVGSNNFLIQKLKIKKKAK